MLIQLFRITIKHFLNLSKSIIEAFDALSNLELIHASVYEAHIS
jgi:hypothetical protein